MHRMELNYMTFSTMRGANMIDMFLPNLSTFEEACSISEAAYIEYNGGPPAPGSISNKLYALYQKDNFFGLEVPCDWRYGLSQDQINDLILYTVALDDGWIDI